MLSSAIHRHTARFEQLRMENKTSHDRSGGGGGGGVGLRQPCFKNSATGLFVRVIPHEVVAVTPMDPCGTKRAWPRASWRARENLDQFTGLMAARPPSRRPGCRMSAHSISSRQTEKPPFAWLRARGGQPGMRGAVRAQLGRKTPVSSSGGAALIGGGGIHFRPSSLVAMVGEGAFAYSTSRPHSSSPLNQDRKSLPPHFPRALVRLSQLEVLRNDSRLTGPW